VGLNSQRKKNGHWAKLKWKSHIVAQHNCTSLARKNEIEGNLAGNHGGKTQQLKATNVANVTGRGTFLQTGAGSDLMRKRDGEVMGTWAQNAGHKVWEDERLSRLGRGIFKDNHKQGDLGAIGGVLT